MERKGLLHIVQDRFYPRICSCLEVNFWSTKLCRKSHQPACPFQFFFVFFFFAFALFSPVSWRGLNVSLIPEFPRGKPSSCTRTTTLTPYTHKQISREHVSLQLLCLQLLWFTPAVTHPRTHGGREQRVPSVSAVGGDPGEIRVVNQTCLLVRILKQATLTSDYCSRICHRFYERSLKNAELWACE